MKLISAVVVSLLFPISAAAQNHGIFVQGGPLLDAAFRSSVDGSGPVSGGLFVDGIATATATDEITHSSQSRFAPGGNLTFGGFVSPSVSLRIEASFAGKQNFSDTTSSASEATSSSSETNIHVTDISIAAAWHHGSGRTSLSYMAGLTFRREVDEVSTSFTYPSLAVVQQGGRLVQVVQSETQTDAYTATVYDRGVMAGVDLTFNLSDHIAVVPQARLVAALYSWNVRPGIALRWRP